VGHGLWGVSKLGARKVARTASEAISKKAERRCDIKVGSRMISGC